MNLIALYYTRIFIITPAIPIKIHWGKFTRPLIQTENSWQRTTSDSFAIYGIY